MSHSHKVHEMKANEIVFYLAASTRVVKKIVGRSPFVCPLDMKSNNS
jgi:hypothetical protein